MPNHSDLAQVALGKNRSRVYLTAEPNTPCIEAALFPALPGQKRENHILQDLPFPAKNEREFRTADLLRKSAA